MFCRTAANLIIDLKRGMMSSAHQKSELDEVVCLGDRKLGYCTMADVEI
jgi:hypothetical protein